MSQAPPPPFRPGDDPTANLSHPDAPYEIVFGQIVEKPAMGIHATFIATNIYFVLRLCLVQNRIGRVVNAGTFILDVESDLRRRPDVALISFERGPAHRAVPAVGDWALAPDLAIEVVIPRDIHSELRRKVRDYFRFGVRQSWVVDPLDESISVYPSPTEVRILRVDDTIDGGDLLPGLSVPIAPLFRATFA